ncbi:MAG: BsaWI family type II restriction enzyme [Candidatus Diapherotrites archaeon]
MDDGLENKWKSFVQKHSDLAHGKIDQFLTDLEKDYKNKKIMEFQAAGADYSTAVGKARQSWVAYVGGSLETLIRFIVEPVAHEHGARIVKGKEIQNSKLNEEYDVVRRNLLIHFDKYSYLPDADLIVYRYEKEKGSKILVILSVKNSFRERYTETPYWKLKLDQSKITKPIKVFMVTPDRDDEISFDKRPSKARVILEYELDGVYIAKNKGEFDSTNKIGNLSNLLDDLSKLLKKE